MPGVAESLALYFAIMIGTMAAGLPIAPATLIVAKVAAPWLVAAVAALAAALSAVGDYALVRRAFRTRALERVRRSAIFAKVERWARLAPFLTTLLFAALRERHPQIAFDVKPALGEEPGVIELIARIAMS